MTTIIQNLAAPILQQPGFLAHHVLFIAKRNNRDRYFIPSNENRIGGIVYNDIMIDSGCNSMLLFVNNSAELRTVLRQQYPVTSGAGPSEHRWSISRGRAVGARGYILTITKNPGFNPFQITLGENLGAGTITDRTLRFYLNKEDLAFLFRYRNSTFRNYFARKDINLLDEGRNTASNIRREHALIGQWILGRCQSWDQQRYLIVFEENHGITAEFMNWWNSTDVVTQLDVHSVLTQPVDFDDLEDEIHSEDVNHDVHGDDVDE